MASVSSRNWQIAPPVSLPTSVTSSRSRASRRLMTCRATPRGRLVGVARRPAAGGRRAGDRGRSSGCPGRPGRRPRRSTARRRRARRGRRPPAGRRCRRPVRRSGSGPSPCGSVIVVMVGSSVQRLATCIQLVGKLRAICMEVNAMSDATARGPRPTGRRPRVAPLVDRGRGRCSPSTASPTSGPSGSPPAAGVTRGALYHQFADKTELFAAVLEAARGQIMRPPGDACSATLPTPTIRRPAARRRRRLARRLDRAGGAAHRPPRRTRRARLGAVAGDRPALRARDGRRRVLDEADGQPGRSPNSRSSRWPTPWSAPSTRPRCTSPGRRTRLRARRAWARSSIASCRALPADVGFEARSSSDAALTECKGDDGVHPQRHAGVGAARPPAPAGRAARGARRHVAEGRLLAVGAVRLLHGDGRRQGRRQLQPRAGQGRRQGGRHARGRRRRRAAALRRRLRRVRRAAVRVLHPRHRDAGQGADRQEGRRPRPRRRWPRTSAPTCAAAPATSRSSTPSRRWPRARRSSRRSAPASGRPAPSTRRPSWPSATAATSTTSACPACCTPRCTSPTTPAPTSSAIDTAAAAAADGVVGRVHRGRHPRRAARRDHPQGLAGHDPGRRAHVATPATCWRSSSPRPASRPRAAAELVDVDYDVLDAGHRPARRDRARAPSSPCGAPTTTCCRAARTPAATSTARSPPAPTPCTRSSRPSASSTPSSSRSRRSPCRPAPATSARCTCTPAARACGTTATTSAACSASPTDRVTVELVSNGGAFGGKEDMSNQAQAALAAWLLDRPVKCTLSREESFRIHAKRHPDPPRVLGRLRRRRDADGGAGARPSATPAPTRRSG